MNGFISLAKENYLGTWKGSAEQVGEGGGGKTQLLFLFCEDEFCFI